jgi:hypothetical protein
MGKQTRGKPPLGTFTVQADDLVVTVDGAEYLPHAGEVVTFKTRIPLRLMRVAGQLQALGDNPAGMVTAFDELIGLLAGMVVSWTWTDDNGAPMPAPTAEALWKLDQNELTWLIGKLTSRTEPAPNSKKP